MKLHRNAALSWNGRVVLVRRVVDQGWTLTAAAEAAGVSVRCARKWVGRYRLDGDAGLRDRSSAPRRVANRTPADRVAAIVALRGLRMTAAEIAETLSMQAGRARVRVDVVDVGGFEARGCESELHRSGLPGGGRLGHVVGVGADAVACELGVDARPSPHGTPGCVRSERQATQGDAPVACGSVFAATGKGSTLLEGASMSVTRKVANLTGVVLPLLGLGVAIALLWDRMVGVRELTILGVGYVVAGLGITVGYHRLFTHRSFQTFPVVRYAFAICGQFAAQGNVVSWVANHRKHHQFADRIGDPHSPHAGRGDGFTEGLSGLWHAHTGWLFDGDAVADRRRYAPDLIDDRGLRIVAGLFVPMVLISVLVPGLVGWAWIGGRYGFLAGVVWGGAVRILLLHHVTWSINSICHYWGRRRFAVRDESRNVWWLSGLSFGESWHNNHHAFPSSAFHGLHRLELDPGGWLIRVLERCGLAWRVVRIPPERQALKLPQA